MNAFNDHLTKDMVNDLLKPLNIYIRVEYDLVDYYYTLAISDFQPLYGHRPNQAEFKYIESYSLDGLLERLFACDRFGGSPNGYWKTIDNPYYGCKNLEEAMIKKDLTYGNQ